LGSGVQSSSFERRRERFGFRTGSLTGMLALAFDFRLVAAAFGFLGAGDVRRFVDFASDSSARG
jgi:hypothetical protein